MKPGDGGETALLAPPRPAGLEAGPRPVLGVVIAAYQAAGTIEAAVSSVLNQTEPPAELVVCDDGSTDSLQQALAPFGDAVSLLRIEHAGESAAKNAGAAALSTPWIVFLDADDAWAPERLQRMADLGAARPDLDLLSTDAWFLVGGRRTGRFHGPQHPFPVDDQATELLGRDWLFAGVAVRRSAWERVGGFDVTISYAADWHCWLRLVLSGSLAGCVDEPLVDYVIHDGSLSANRSASLLARVRVLDDMHQRYALTGEQRLAAAGMRAVSLRRARLAQAEHALLSGRAARSACLAYACSPGVPPVQRARAIAAMAAPRMAGRRLRRTVAAAGRATSDRSTPSPR